MQIFCNIKLESHVSNVKIANLMTFSSFYDKSTYSPVAKHEWKWSKKIKDKSILVAINVLIFYNCLKLKSNISASFLLFLFSFLRILKTWSIFNSHDAHRMYIFKWSFWWEYHTEYLIINLKKKKNKSKYEIEYRTKELFLMKKKTPPKEGKHIKSGSKWVEWSIKCFNVQ